MKYYIRMWDDSVQRYIYLIELYPTLSKWSKYEGHTRVQFDSIKEAHKAVVDHRWAMTEIMDAEEIKI